MTRHEEILAGYTVWTTIKGITDNAMFTPFEAGARFADMCPKDGWHSVTDELPQDLVRVLVVNPKGDFGIAFHLGKRWFGTWDKVTHWMPLPQPPEED
jgi:hypothetical protein